MYGMIHTARGAPERYESHDSPENVMTHEVEGVTPENVMTHITQEVRRNSGKGGRLRRSSLQGLPEHVVTYTAKEAILNKIWRALLHKQNLS